MIPWVSKNERFGFEKICNRRSNSSAVVCASSKLQLNGSSVSKMTLFVSNGGNTIIEAKKTASFIMDKSNITDEIKETLEKDIGSGEDCLLLTKLIKKMVRKLKNNEQDEIRAEIHANKFECPIECNCNLDQEKGYACNSLPVNLYLYGFDSSQGVRKGDAGSTLNIGAPKLLESIP